MQGVSSRRKTLGTQAIESRERVDWVDAAKGISIILVVMMHSTLGLGEAIGREGWLHDVVAFARPFRIPAFFMVAGLFLSRTIHRDWRTYADKRVVHFAYFYGLWLLIQSGLKVGQIAQGSPLLFIWHLVTSLIEPFGTLWFIYLLAVVSVVTKLLVRFPKPVLFILAATLEVLPIHTGWVLMDEFCDRYIYFVTGYLFAPMIFTFAHEASRRTLAAMAGLVLWALINGLFAFGQTGHPFFKTWASLPFISLGLGWIGALSVIAIAAQLNRRKLGRPLIYCGHHSIAIYLAFFLPMALSRSVFIRLGLVKDVGLTSLLIMVVAIITPLIVEWMIRGTVLGFLFSRPKWAHLSPTQPQPVSSADFTQHSLQALRIEHQPETVLPSPLDASELIPLPAEETEFSQSAEDTEISEPSPLDDPKATPHLVS